jgi:hypothetical protein
VSRQNFSPTWREVLLRSLLGKQCKPVQVHSFETISLRGDCLKLLAGATSPDPFEQQLRCWLFSVTCGQLGHKFAKRYFSASCWNSCQILLCHVKCKHRKRNTRAQHIWRVYPDIKSNQIFTIKAVT